MPASQGYDPLQELDNVLAIDPPGGRNGPQDAVHPVFTLCVGSTMVPSACAARRRAESQREVVPHKIVIVDSMTYEDQITRLGQNGWSEEEARRLMPRNNYLQLYSPFSPTFDFDHSLNRHWCDDLIFETGLKATARHTAGKPGFGGVRAIGRASAEGNIDALYAFFRQNLQELGRIRPNGQFLRPEVLTYILTTGRGGTGTGATLPIAAALRAELGDEAIIRLVVLMPDIFGGDGYEYAAARATAMLRDIQHYHCDGEHVPIHGREPHKAPFTSITLVCKEDSQGHTLMPRDAMAQVDGIVWTLLRPATQAAIAARQVDVQVPRFDDDGKPNLVRQECALSITLIAPDIENYLAVVWIHQELTEVSDHLEQWRNDGRLTAQEEQTVQEVVDLLCRECALTKDGLLRRLDPSPSPENVLRISIEQWRTKVASQKVEWIKATLPNMPVEVQGLCAGFVPAWKERARSLISPLSQEITVPLRKRLAAKPQVYFFALKEMDERLTRLAAECQREAAAAQKQREEAGIQLFAALNSVQSTGRIILPRAEVVRDAGLVACQRALTAGHARVRQERAEVAYQMLMQGFVAKDSAGNLESPGLIKTLCSLQQDEEGKVRERFRNQLVEVSRRKKVLGGNIQERSRVFDATLLLDDADPAQLEQIVEKLREHTPEVEPIIRLVIGEQALEPTIVDLLPLLPTHTTRGRSLEDVLRRNPAAHARVVGLLRNAAFPTPLDHVVETQQELNDPERHDSYAIYGVPGGREGYLGQLLQREGLVTNPNQIVEAGEEAIRIYHAREGLPLAVVKPLQKYEAHYRRYMERPNGITPHAARDGHLFPSIESPSTSLRSRTERLLYLAKVVLPYRVAILPAGGFVARYDQDTGHGFSTVKEQTFGDFATLRRWMAREFAIRRALDRELVQTLNANKEHYVATVLAAYRQTIGDEQQYLQQELFRLGVDPARSTNIANGIDKTVSVPINVIIES